MAIMTRVTRLFRADVHAVLDRMEEPDVLLRQALREMEDEVAQHAQFLRARELERKQAQARLDAIAATQAEIGGQLDLCFDAGNEALARTLLRRKLEGERMSRHLAQRLAALDQLIGERRTQLEERRRVLEAMRQKAEVFDTEAAQATHVDATRFGAEDFSVTDADVELAWLKERQQRGTT